MRGSRAFANPWDRDVEFKQALGVPAEIFARSASILRARSGSDR